MYFSSSCCPRSFIVTAHAPFVLTQIVNCLECVPPPPLGMTSGDVPDHMISASSENVSRPARDARFDMPGSWCALRSVRGEWLEVDLGRIATLVAVATQGNGNDSWVKAFNLQFSADNVTWYCDRHEGKIKVSSKKLLLIIEFLKIRSHELLPQNISVPRSCSEISAYV